MDDPHAVLGLERHADKAEIKRAYRALAKVWHPDGHRGDPVARERFVQINEAYRALMDEDGSPDMRKRAGPRASAPRPTAPAPRAAAAAGPAAPEPQGGEAPEPSDDEMMERIFGVTPPRKTIDDAPSLDAAAGDEAPAPPAEAEKPEEVRGLPNGRTVLLALNALFGRRSRPRRSGSPDKDAAQPTDETLRATASVPLATIVTGGTVEAALPDGRHLLADIARGTEDGSVLVLAPEKTGLPGPVELTVAYAPSERFRHAGRDVHATLAIDLETAVLGGVETFETLDGPIRLTVPAWSGSDRTLRVAARGLPRAGDDARDDAGDDAGHGRGDLLVHLRVVLPESADPRIVEVMKQRREGVYV